MSRSPPTAVFDAPLSEGRRSLEVWLSVGTLLPRVVAKDGSGVFLCVSHAPPTTRLTSSISTTCPRQTYFCTVRILMRVGPVPPQLGTTICESLTKALTKSHCHLASRHLDTQRLGNLRNMLSTGYFAFSLNSIPLQFTDAKHRRHL